MRRINRFFFGIIIMLSFCLSPFTYGADKMPVEVKQDDKCPVCGMFVAKYKNWLSQIIFKDGTYAVFDGPKDMFKYYLDIGNYNPSKKSSDIAAIYVTEYYSTKVMDARQMIFVLGSDVYGPMGDELIPIKSENAAREFMKDHKGKKILRFHEVTAEHLK